LDESRNKVVVTGAGAVAPGFSEGVRGALRLASGAPLPASEITAFEVPADAPSLACELADFDGKPYLTSTQTFLDRATALAVAGARLALEDAGLFDREARPGETGLAYATAFGCLDAMETFFGKVKAGKARFASPLPFSHAYANSPSSLVAIEFGLAGHAATFSGGETAGLAALGSAADAVAHAPESLARGGVLAGASEAFSRAAWRHARANGLLSPTGRVRPLAPDADGTVLGEAGAFLVLERADRAAARGARVLGRLAGHGSSARAGAEGLALAARAAMEGADGEPPLVLTGASGVPGRDAIEREALDVLGLAARAGHPKRCFGDCGAASPVLAALAELGHLASGKTQRALVTALDRSGAWAVLLEAP